MQTPELTCKEYEAYREYASKFATNLLTNDKYFSIEWAATQLGILHNNTVVIESEIEMDCLFDFAFFESMHEGVKSIKKILIDLDTFDANELQIIQKANQAIFSFFEIKDVNPETYTLLLCDINTKKEYLVMDKARSSVSYVLLEQIIIVNRLVPIGNYTYRTSGGGFNFHKKDKQKLLNALGLEKLKRPKLTSAQLYIWLFKKSRQFGLEARLADN